MKRSLIIACTIVMAGFLSAFMSIEGYYGDIWQQLAMSPQDAKGSIFTNFQEGNLQFPYSGAVKGLIAGKRAGAVKELGDYIRKYVSSPEFSDQYKTARDAAKPAAPADGEEKIKARLVEIKHDIEQNEKDMKTARGDMAKLYEATITMLKQEQKALLDSSHPEHGMFVANITGNLAGALSPEDYKQAMKDFEVSYPATVSGLVKKRLKEFLDMTKDMDFSAKLIDRGGVKKFADPALEAKDELWKKCFRCGEETIKAARAYATQWLQDIK